MNSAYSLRAMVYLMKLGPSVPSNPHHSSSSTAIRRRLRVYEKKKMDSEVRRVELASTALQRIDKRKDTDMATLAPIISEGKRSELSLYDGTGIPRRTEIKDKV